MVWDTAGEIDRETGWIVMVWDTAGEIDRETGWIGMECDTYGVEGKMYIRIWWRNLKEREHSENLSVDGRKY